MGSLRRSEFSCDCDRFSWCVNNQFPIQCNGAGFNCASFNSVQHLHGLVLSTYCLTSLGCCSFHCSLGMWSSLPSRILRAGRLCRLQASSSGSSNIIFLAQFGAASPARHACMLCSTHARTVSFPIRARRFVQQLFGLAAAKNIATVDPMLRPLHHA